MGNMRAGKHFKESGSNASSSRAGGSRGTRRGGKMWRVVVVLLATIGLGTIVTLAVGSVGASRYQTLEDVWNDYENEIKEGIVAGMAERGIDWESLGATTSASENDLVLSFVLPADYSLLNEYFLQRNMSSEDASNEMAETISTMESWYEERGVHFDGNARMISVFRDNSGEEVARGTFTRDGLESFEGKEISLTYADVWNDDLFSDSRATLESEWASTAEELKTIMSGTESWIEAHGNELEFVVRLGEQSDGVDPEAANASLRTEEHATAMSGDVRAMSEYLREQGIELGDITYRITYRSLSDEVIATCAYSESGVVEG